MVNVHIAMGLLPHLPVHGPCLQPRAPREAEVVDWEVHDALCLFLMDLDPSSALEANIREFCYQQPLSWTRCSLTLHALSVSIRADARALQHLDIQALLATLDCLCQADH